MKYVFGPVPSRRLGMSLGVDVIPFKTCTYNCIYCQLGRTTHKSMQRRPYVSKEDVLKELRDVLAEVSDRIDFITFSGSGEPTLNIEIGEMIEQIKTFTEKPVAVLTNGSLLYREDVRKDLSRADVVAPSLDAFTEKTFMKVNRPHRELTPELILRGLEEFSQEFQGKIWLEIMLVRGVNDNPEELSLIAEMCRNLKLDKIHLNTVIRPPAEESAYPLTSEEMLSIAKLFRDRAEVIADFDKLTRYKAHGATGQIEDHIISLLRRRPCTVDDISSSLGIHKNEVIKCIDHLAESGSIKRIRYGDRWYYETW